MDEPTVDAAAARDAARLLVEAKRFADAQALLRDAANQARSAQDWSGLYVLLEALGALLRNQEQRVEAVSVFLDALWACQQAQGSADQLGRLEATLAFTLVNRGAACQEDEPSARSRACCIVELRRFTAVARQRRRSERSAGCVGARVASEPRHRASRLRDRLARACELAARRARRSRPALRCGDRAVRVGRLVRRSPGPARRPVEGRGSKVRPVLRKIGRASCRERVEPAV